VQSVRLRKTLGELIIKFRGYELGPWIRSIRITGIAPGQHKDNWFRRSAAPQVMKPTQCEPVCCIKVANG
jgi:hypothetical protein